MCLFVKQSASKDCVFYENGFDTAASGEWEDNDSASESEEFPCQRDILTLPLEIYESVEDSQISWLWLREYAEIFAFSC